MAYVTSIMRLAAHWGDPIRAAVVLTALLAARPAGGSFGVPVQVRVVETSVEVHPSSGTATTRFTATLTYTPKGAACPPGTQVRFTWDGRGLGTSPMEGTVSPCRATLATAPLAGYTAPGTHQVCGTFSYQGSHKACAPFQVTIAGSTPPASHQPTPQTHGTTAGSSSSPNASSQSPRSSPRNSTSGGISTPGASPTVGGSASGSSNGGNGTLFGAALAVLVLFGARAFFQIRRRRARSE